MKKIIFWELVLVLATVPIFRALWILIDSVDRLNETAGILVSLAAGLTLAVWALVRINSK